MKDGKSNLGERLPVRVYHDFHAFTFSFFFFFSFLALDGEAPNFKRHSEKKVLEEDERISINTDFLHSFPFLLNSIFTLK